MSIAGSNVTVTNCDVRAGDSELSTISVVRSGSALLVSNKVSSDENPPITTNGITIAQASYGRLIDNDITISKEVTIRADMPTLPL